MVDLVHASKDAPWLWQGHGASLDLAHGGAVENCHTAIQMTAAGRGKESISRSTGAESLLNDCVREFSAVNKHVDLTPFGGGGRPRCVACSLHGPRHNFSGLVQSGSALR